MSMDLVVRDSLLITRPLLSYVTEAEATPDTDGVRFVFQFPNGYGASVIRNRYSYGGLSGKFEVGVLDSDGNLDYSTEIMSDVLGHLSVSDVDTILTRIFRL